MATTRIATAQRQSKNAHLWLRRIIAAIVTIAFVLSFSPESSLWIIHRTIVNEELDDSDLHKMLQRTPGEDRCSKPGGSKTSQCSCLDPLVPQPRVEFPNWMENHRVMTEEVKTVNDVDVVLIGDSLVERWRGTMARGSKPAKQYRRVFDTYFNRTTGGNVSGLALGSGGDVTPQTLWHVQNGLIPNNLKPKLFYLLIGTNDLHSGCSKKTVLVGILNIADYLHRLRPNIPILFHGLLPRTGPGRGAGSNKLGIHWKNIVWINRELKKYAQMHANWYYMDSSAIFLEPNEQTGDIVLNRNLMPDGLHPSVEGYRRWGKRIVGKVNKILENKSSL